MDPLVKLNITLKMNMTYQERICLDKGFESISFSGSSSYMFLINGEVKIGRAIVKGCYFFRFQSEVKLEDDSEALKWIQIE